jgi:23S rRNA pseudouridine1911/1915/1917 synthase
LLEAKLEYFPLVQVRKNEVYRQNMTLLRVELETGRKHQIRAQLSHIGHPIVGDVKYGSSQTLRDLPLHSHRLEFPHPTKDLLMTFYSYPPAHWAKRFGSQIYRGIQRLFPAVMEEEPR